MTLSEARMTTVASASCQCAGRLRGGVFSQEETQEDREDRSPRQFLSFYRPLEAENRS